ncbi:hypothetical protein PRIC2_001248 [Phytophthora ramorum]
MPGVLADPTLILSEASSGPNDHDRCDGESSSSDDVFYADTVQPNTGQWHVVDGSTGTEGSDSDSESESWMFDTMAGGWTFVSLTQDVAQIALDAVRYQRNYARTVTSRLCLHYINTIRKRVSSGLTNYLFNVDGCASSLLEATGRCDIYYCRPYTYELQLTQKFVGGDVFIVQSIYKTVDQKTLDGFRAEESNLDWSTAGTGTGNESVMKQAEIPLEHDQPRSVRGAVTTFLEGSTFLDGGEEGPSAGTSDLNNFLKNTAAQQHVTTQPLSLRADPVSLSESHPEVVGSDCPGATTVAIIGIAAVAVSTIAFVLALVVVRWRAQAKSKQRAMILEYSPSRGTLNTAENTISMISRDSIGTDTKQPDFEKVEFFGEQSS